MAICTHTLVSSRPSCIITSILLTSLLHQVINPLSSPSPAFVSCGPRGTSWQSSLVLSWMNHIFGGLNVNENAVAKFFGGKTYMNVGRTGPTKQTPLGYVPWAVPYKANYPEIDGVYEPTKDDKTIFRKISKKSPSDNLSPNISPNIAISNSTFPVYELIFKPDDPFKIQVTVVDDDGEKKVVETKHIIVLGEDGAVKNIECDDSLIRIILDKQTSFEIARIRCVHDLQWMSWWKAETCNQYASGMVATVSGATFSFELVGEYFIRHFGICLADDLSETRNIRAFGRLPFDIHVKASYGYSANAAYTPFAISGTYRLDMDVGKSYWHRLPFNSEEGHGYLMDFYWDKLNVIDIERNTVLYKYAVSPENPLYFDSCCAGFTTELWDQKLHKEVATIFCGPRQVPKSFPRSAVMCWQYPSGKMQTFANMEEVNLERQFFPLLAKVHDKVCTVEEVGIVNPAPSSIGLQLGFVVLITSACCVGLISLVVSFMVYCCFSKILPTTRKRKAGFEWVTKDSIVADGIADAYSDEDTAAEVKGTGEGGIGVSQTAPGITVSQRSPVNGPSQSVAFDGVPKMTRRRSFVTSQEGI